MRTLDHRRSRVRTFDYNPIYLLQGKIDLRRPCESKCRCRADSSSRDTAAVPLGAKARSLDLLLGQILTSLLLRVCNTVALNQERWFCKPNKFCYCRSYTYFQCPRLVQMERFVDAIFEVASH